MSQAIVLCIYLFLLKLFFNRISIVGNDPYDPDLDHFDQYCIFFIFCKLHLPHNYDLHDTYIAILSQTDRHTYTQTQILVNYKISL